MSPVFKENKIRLHRLATALAIVLGSSSAMADQKLISALFGDPVGPPPVPGNQTSNFTMLQTNGANQGGTNDVDVFWDGTVFTANSDYTGPGTTANMTLASITPFSSNVWTAHDIQVFGPGTYTFDVQAGNDPGEAEAAGFISMTVGPNQLGVHMLFDWNVARNIDVVVVWDQNGVFGSGRGSFDEFFNGANVCGIGGGGVGSNCLHDGPGPGAPGTINVAGNFVWGLVSVDVNGDGIPGAPMPTGGPFAGFYANFNLSGISGFAPLVLDDAPAQSVPVGGALNNVDILGNDLDVDGTIVATSVTVSNETNVTVTVNGDGTVNITEALGSAGTGSFTYTVQDNDTRTSDSATVTVNIGVGNPPTAVNDTDSTLEDTLLTINKVDLLANDTDPDPDTLSIISVTQPPLGEGAVVDQGATLDFMPGADFNGVTSFTYTITDGNGNNDTATVAITVSPVNDTPVAQNDSSTAAFNTAVIISVLANDSDVDMDTLTVTGTSNGPSNGGVVINGDNTITYTPNTGYSGGDSFDYTIDDGNGGIDTASVSVSVLGAAVFVGNPVVPFDSNNPVNPELSGASNFSMLQQSGLPQQGGTNDIGTTWDGTVRTSTADPSPNMTIFSAKPEPFSGFVWLANNVRVFGPGSYTFEACLNDGSTACTAPRPLSMTVGPMQLGLHMTFDWGKPDAGKPCGKANCSIDVVEVVEINQAWAGPTNGANPLGATGAVFNMAVVDGDGDGIPGIPMVDGAFVGFNANFNLNLTPLFALPPVTATAVQNGSPASVIVPTGGLVTVTANMPAGKSYTFDWDSTLVGQRSDAALVTANTNGTTSQTFVFDPSALADGPLTARVTIRDPALGNLANYAVTSLEVSSATVLADAADANGNGIPDGQDGGLPATQLPTVAGDNVNFVMQADSGTLRLGDLALAAGAISGGYAAGLSAVDIGVADAGVTSSCVGGCFDFEVTGLANGATVNVVLPLSIAIDNSSGNAAYRKLQNNVWRNYSLLGGDAIASAPGGPGTCPPPGDAAYQTGLNDGDFCVQLTATDGGRNDADGTANGTFRDPGGVGPAAAQVVGGAVKATNPKSLGGGGCVLDVSSHTSGYRGEWWLVAAVLGMLGIFGRKRKHNRA